MTRAGEKSKRIVLVTLLTVAALGIRLLRAAQEPVVNPDAVRFIDQAKLLMSDPVGAVRGEVYHPLHSVAGWVMHAVIGGMFADDRMAWIRAMQGVGVIAGVIVGLVVYRLSRVLGAPFWAAMGAMLVWTVGRRSTSYGADGISDMLFLAMFGGAMLVALRAMRVRHGKFARGAMGRFFAAGVLAGLAYLTRPEGLAVVLIEGATLLMFAMPRPRRVGALAGGMMELRFKLFPRRRLAAGAAMKGWGVMMAGMLLMALPYMLTIGAITHKKNLVEMMVPGGVELSAMGLAVRTNLTMFDTIQREVVETFNFAPAVLVGLAILLKFRMWGRARTRLLVVTWVVLWTSVMFWLLERHGYLDGRHTLPLQLVLHGWFALALVAWRRPMVWWQNFWRGREVWGKLPGWMRWDGWPNVMAAGVLVLALVPGVVHLWLPQSTDRFFVRESAAWLGANVKPETVVCDIDRVVGYYSGLEYALYIGTPEEPLEAELDRIDRDVSGTGPRRPLVVTFIRQTGRGEVIMPMVGRFQLIATFQSEGAAHGDVMCLYEDSKNPALKSEKIK